MKFSWRWDRIITLVSAMAAPVLALLVSDNVMSAESAAHIGAILTAFVGAYHLRDDAVREAMARLAAQSAPAAPGVDPDTLSAK